LPIYHKRKIKDGGKAMRDGKQSYDDYKVDAVAYLQPNWIIFSFMMFCSFISGLMDYHIFG
jgi:hypothetical protein